MNISIKDETVELKYGFRAMMLFENIREKSFTIEDTTDVVTFMYCCYLSGKGSASWDDFLDFIDENPDIVVEFSDFMRSKIENENFKKKETATKTAKRTTKAEK